MLEERQEIREKEEKGEKIEPERKKYIDYTLRNYAKKELDSIIDVLNVLRALPGNQVKTLITAERIIGVLQLLKNISYEVVPIELDAQGNHQAVYRFKMAIKLDKPVNGKDHIINTMKYMFPATPEEVKLAKELEPYMSILGNFIHEDDINRVYTVEDWNKYGTSRLHEIITRRGQSFRLDIDEVFVIGVEKALSPSEVRKVEEAKAQKEEPK